MTAPVGVTRRRIESVAWSTPGPTIAFAGALNLPRSPQGRPVLVQAGSSETGRAFAARHADAIFTAQLEPETAQAFYADVKGRVKGEGAQSRSRAHFTGAQPGYCE